MFKFISSQENLSTIRQKLKYVLKCFHELYLSVQKLTALSFFFFFNGMEKNLIRRQLECKHKSQ